MKRFKIPPPKTRPFDEPKQTLKTKVWDLSVNDNKQPSKPVLQPIANKLSTKISIITLIFGFCIIAFILYISKMNNFEIFEKWKISFRNHFNNFYNNVKSNNTKVRIESSELINYYPLQYLLNEKFINLIPKSKISLIFNDIITSLYCTILVLTVIQPTNSNLFFSLLFVIISFFSDSFIKNSMKIKYIEKSNENTAHAEQSISVSIEFLLSIMLIYILFCLLTKSNSKSHFNFWCFLLSFSMFLVSTCLSFRIEYISFLMPIAINAIIKIRYQFISIFVFVFIFILNSIYLILIDRFIGLPKITFDSISILSITNTLFETDYNGLIPFILIVIILHLFFLIPISLIINRKNANQNSINNNNDINNNTNGNDASNNKNFVIFNRWTKNEIIFIEEILFVSFCLIKISISSADNACLSRAYIIRLFLYIIIGKLIGHYQSITYSIILLVILDCLALFYYIFDLSTSDVIKLIKK